LSAIDGACGGSSGKPFIAAPGFNISVVNRPARDLFPTMYLVKMQCARNETKGAAPFGFGNIAMGVLGLLSLVESHWAVPAAIVGGLYYGLAGAGHVFRSKRNFSKWTASRGF
jgi:hypothetical protein